MAIQTRSAGGMLSDINVTPFVDVMLVLLIIFMVTAPMLTQGLDVQLPQTRTVEVLPTDSDHLVLNIARDGAMTLDQYPVTLENLKAQVEVNVIAQKKQLFLKADKDVPYGVVVGAMGEIKAAGLEKLGVVAEPDLGAPDAAPAGANAPAGQAAPAQPQSQNASGS
ncbi:ExbD/TolR family protein [Oceanidesulfovibrio marinus]|uniref:ExbD/TolR family protein n=1 Tax=Oceanidesulfovibrio marinus TaxID=370038 RepID=A0ABX6NJ95_9BACT|nr:ExbD/TolR family protein [Oceanidesulfovibrio marinus]QJT10654.1 ExbD/TolR family protein [Oceanidesulfovibrio marinus]